MNGVDVATMSRHSAHPEAQRVTNPTPVAWCRPSLSLKKTGFAKVVLKNIFGLS